MEPKKSAGRPKKTPEAISMSEILMGGEIKRAVEVEVDVTEDKVLPPPIVEVEPQVQTMQRVGGSGIVKTTQAQQATQTTKVASQTDGVVLLYDTVFNRHERYPARVAERLIKIAPTRYKKP